MTEQQIFEAACAAAIKAFNGASPDPMVVVGTNFMEIVEDGVCGFAWVKIKPARGKFVAYLKKNEIGDVSYTGGYEIWMGSAVDGAIGASQSYERKLSAARAFAKVLNENGITAIPQGRLD